MKNRIFAILATLGCLLLLQPQNSQAQGFEWGLRLGGSISSLVGIDNTRPQVGLFVGGVGNYFFNDSWGVGTDIAFSQQGARCKPNGNGVAIDYNFNYLNIPLLGIYQISLGDMRHLRLVAGVQMGLFLSGDYKYKAPSVVGEGLVAGGDKFDKSSFHPVDYGVSVGAQLPLWKSILIEVRYTLGITQTHNGISSSLGGNYYISVPDNRNSVLQIGTTFLY